MGVLSKGEPEKVLTLSEELWVNVKLLSKVITLVTQVLVPHTHSSTLIHN